MRYIQEKINLAESVNLSLREQVKAQVESEAVLTGYVVDTISKINENRLHPAVLILPGGGYGHTSAREADPIALKMAAEGICAFILHYHVAPVTYPIALCEALLSLKYIRDHAKEYGIDAENIGVCGFSAGGHLAASVGVHWNSDYVKRLISGEASGWRPNRLLLSYPVISSGEFAHRGSFDNLLGEEKESKKWLDFFSLEKHVSSDTPIAFLWHTYEDQAVPVQNTMLFANALIAHHIPIELHVYRRGGHGLSLGNHLVIDEYNFKDRHESSDWIERAISFIYD